MLNFITQYWIQILFGLIISLFTYLIKQITAYKKKLDLANQGIIFLLKIEIIERYNLCIKKESITIEEKEVIIELYNVYKEFECCDVIEDLIKKINAIPIE